MSQHVIVQKFGGSSVAEPKQIRAIAAGVKKLCADGHQVIVVVSAMGKTTDQLISLAYQVSPEPNRRELDMLLSAGERISMALMSMALNDAGVPAISFTGSQAGIMTDEQYSNARILEIKPIRVEAELKNDRVVVLAGFQGVSPASKEVTTLGRGGTDVTAVAMALHFKAQRCEIRKDVEGVYSADPGVVKEARPLPRLSYQQMLDITFWGAKVLHYRSVELATTAQIPILVGLSHEVSGSRSSVIDQGEMDMFEKPRVLSVNSHSETRWVDLPGSSLAASISALHQKLSAAGLPLPQFLNRKKTALGWRILVTAPSEALRAVEKVCSKAFGWNDAPLATVTATCQGSFASAVPAQLAQAVEKNGIPVHKMIFGSMSVTLLVDAAHREKTVQVLHSVQL